MSTAPTVQEIAAFMATHSRELKGAPLDKLTSFVDWFWRDRRCGVLRNEGKIVAVVLVRCMTTPEQAKDPYYHNEAGPLVWVDDIVSQHPAGIATLFKLAVNRFGPRSAFAGKVFVRAGELRMLPWKIIERLTKEQDPGANTHVHDTSRATCSA